MDWLSVVPFVVVAAILLMGTGLLVTSAARLPWFARFASAPAATTAVVALTAVVCGLLDVRFGPWPVVVGLLLSAALAWGVRLLLDSWDRRNGLSEPTARIESELTAGPPVNGLQPAPGWVIWAALLAGLALMVRHWRSLLGRPDAFSQTYDNIFHMNAVRWILETGNGSSLSFAMTTGSGDPMYYPVGWHDVVALVNMLVRDDNVALSINAVTLVALGLVWTSGCLFLVRSITNGNWAVLLGAAVLSASFAAFPFLLLGFGVLYPNFLGLCLLPAGIALTVHVLGIQSGPALHLPSTILVGLLVLLGAGLAHPNVLLSYVVILLPLLAAGVWNALLKPRDSGWTRRLVLRSALFLLAIPATVIAWEVLRPAEHEAIWQPYLSIPDAVGNGILFSAPQLWPAWPLAILSMIGVYAAFRWRRNRAFVIAHGLLLGLWVVASAMPAGDLRSFLVGVWYNDSYRLASLLPITGIPLAVLGVEQLAHLLDAGLARVLEGRDRLQAVVAVVLAVLLALATQTSNWLNRAIDSFAETFALTPDSPLVTTDEYAIIQAAGTIVPEDTVIATNPWNGSSMVFALTGIPTTTTHVSYVLTEDLAVVKDELDEAAVAPEVCDVVRRFGIGYALDFGPREVHGGDHEYVGFDSLADAPGFELVIQQGEAALYEVTACR